MKARDGKGRLTAFVRQWRVLMDLSMTDISLSATARKYGVCERTLRRDVQALALAGFPVKTIHDEGRAWFCLGVGDKKVAIPTSSQLDTHG